jgi:hypothetical protein
MDQALAFVHAFAPISADAEVNTPVIVDPSASRFDRLT